MHAPLLHTLPAFAQSVQAPPPLPHAALAFAEAQPASVQHVLQLLGLHGAGPVSGCPLSLTPPFPSPGAPASVTGLASWSSALCPVSTARLASSPAVASSPGPVLSSPPASGPVTDASPIPAPAE